MKDIIKITKIERKRILDIRMYLAFLGIVALFSLYSTVSALKSYYIPISGGGTVTWQENLAHAKAGTKEKLIDRELLDAMRKREEETVYLDERNLEELIAANYEGRSVSDLSEEDIGNFYSRRLANIRRMLEESQMISYTQEEITDFMKSAGMVSEIACGYAEGWKVLNRDMSVFAALLVLLIAVLLVPLFGSDARSDMKELCRGTKHGKKPLDYARMLTAYFVGSSLYLSGIILFFIIKMLPFGFEGWNQHIQSRAETLFSLYHITNLEQFLMNVMIGFAALIFAVSFALFVTVFMEKVMTGTVVILFFWILLLLFDQMHLWPVNHYFANFMPLRMTFFSHYYIGNEIYRIFGQSVSCMRWSILLSLMLAGILALSAAGWECVKRKRGLY